MVSEKRACFVNHQAQIHFRATKDNINRQFLINSTHLIPKPVQSDMPLGLRNALRLKYTPADTSTRIERLKRGGERRGLAGSFDIKSVASSRRRVWRRGVPESECSRSFEDNSNRFLAVINFKARSINEVGSPNVGPISECGGTAPGKVCVRDKGGKPHLSLQVESEAKLLRGLPVVVSMVTVSISFLPSIASVRGALTSRR